MITTLIILTLLWSFYISIEGVREGFYWRQNALSTSPIKFNIHGIFLAQRIVVVGFIVLVLILKGIVFYKISLFVQAIILISPFLHNGFYYSTRNWIDNKTYINKFFDQSTTSTAKSTKYLTPVLRSIYFTIGLILIITIILV